MLTKMPGALLYIFDLKIMITSNAIKNLLRNLAELAKTVNRYL